MRNGKATLIVILTLLIAIVILVPLYFIAAKGPVPTPPMPAVNAFDTLAEAGSMVVDTDLMEDATMGEFVAANELVAELVAEAVGQDSMVPITEAVLDPIQDIRNALRVQWAKGRLAELEEDYDTAAREYAKLYKLAKKIDKGGLLVHVQVGFAIRRMALQGLKSVIPHLINKEDEEGLVGELLGTVGDDLHRVINIEGIKQREDQLTKRSHGMFLFLITKWQMGDVGAEAYAATEASNSEIKLLAEEVFNMLEKKASGK